MAVWTYDDALQRLLAHEGGYTNHPSDPGGPTHFGITIYDYRKYIDASATAADVRDMSVGQAKAIYKSKYWNAMRCDELPAGVDYAVFDYGVNSGTGRAPKVLKRVIGLDAADSIVTPRVIAAVGRRDAKAVVDALCDERLRFLKSRRTWPMFGAGWERRVREVRAAATAMAVRTAAVPTPPDRTRTAPGRGEIPESRAVKETIRTGVPAAAAAGGYGFWDWFAAHPGTSVVLAVLIAGGIVFGLDRLNRWRRTRQATPMPDTPIVPALTQARVEGFES